MKRFFTVRKEDVNVSVYNEQVSLFSMIAECILSVDNKMKLVGIVFFVRMSVCTPRVLTQIY